MSMNELNSELNKIQETKTLLKEAIINKGQEVLDTDSFRSYVDKVSNITTGIDTSDATAVDSDIVSGKTAYNASGKVTGTVLERSSTTGGQFKIEDNMVESSYSNTDYVVAFNQDMNIQQDTLVRAGSTWDIWVAQSAIANAINLTSDKVIEGNTILGIEGTGKTSEDLQEQLDAQDTVIQQLQDELVNKTSGSAKPNIFMQEDEPTTKNGIWLKGSYQVDNIVADENVFAGEEWNTTKMSSLKAIPYGFYNGSAVSIGTDVYLFGGSGGGTIAYKYDTLTDTYTQLTNIPYTFYQGSAVSVGTNVYLFGSFQGSYRTYAYKYDTLTDTYTQLTNISYDFYYGSAVSVGTNVYLFGTNAYYQTNAYKYDTLTDKYTKLTNIPYNFCYGSAISIGTNVYLFGGSGNSTIAYKYDTLTDTYTQLANIPYSFYYGSAIFTGTDVYLFGGSANAIKVQVMTMTPNDYGNNSIVISQGVPSNKTNIANYGIQNAKFYYDRVYYQDENGELLNTIPTYNGNGTEWVKISGGEE